MPRGRPRKKLTEKQRFDILRKITKHEDNIERLNKKIEEDDRLIAIQHTLPKEYEEVAEEIKETE